MDALRSLLSVPGNQRRMLEKAPGYGADALIVDLEDSVPVGEKPDARLATREFIAGGAQGAITYVRVNSWDTGLTDDDLDAIVIPGLAGIQLPKADSPSTVRAVDARLAALEKERDLPPGSIEIIVSLESAAGIYRCYDILSAAARIGSCLVGVAENGDLQRDVGYAHTESGIETLYIRSKVLLEARHAGILNPLDGVYSAVANMAGFEAESLLARQIGYRGKKVIHPKQIEPANRIFMPTASEIDFQERVLAALADAEKQRSAATTVDGMMVDIAMEVNARRVLDWARRVKRA